jgi:hypothetical protein
MTSAASLRPTVHQPGVASARNIRWSSPEAIKARNSLAPPISVPLTNTMGKVGQPDHILSAVRGFHIEK